MLTLPFMLLDLHARLKDALRSTIRTHWNAEPPEIVLNQTPKIEFGELATPVAFELARQLKKPPRVIAEELIARTGKIDGVERMVAAGAGYLNFYLDRASAVRGSRLRGFPSDEGKVIVEHTNINPNKAAHIGHLRNAALGDTFVRMLRAGGHQVEEQNYIDTTGVQALIDDPAVRFDYLCWDRYARTSSHYKDLPESLAWRTGTLHAIESGQG